MNINEIWVLKVPTELDEHVLQPIIVDGQDYTACNEKESGYGGMYPESIQIINYYVPKPHGYLIVPYTSRKADPNYGFYEFDTRSAMTSWLKKNIGLTKDILNSNPEFFI